MQTVTQKLIALLDVVPQGGDHFIGDSEDLGFPNVFGGQVLGQALVAGSRTVEGRLAHSMHAYFLRPGDPALAIDYEVQRVRDGGTFSTRRVIARQQEREILTAMVSFQVQEDGLEHQHPMPEAPAPESLTSEFVLRKRLEALMPADRRERLMKPRAIDMRPVNPVDPRQPETRPPHGQTWLRAEGDLPDDQVMHRALLAYASDFSFLATSVQPHGVTFFDPRMQVASLDHAMWFHRPLRMDDWLLYDKDSPSAAGGRGFNRGNLFSRDGTLVASVCQEALIRKRR